VEKELALADITSHTEYLLEKTKSVSAEEETY
jgi:hypothetical protein